MTRSVHCSFPVLTGVTYLQVLSPLLELHQVLHLTGVLEPVAQQVSGQLCGYAAISKLQEVAGDLEKELPLTPAKRKMASTEIAEQLPKV